MIRCECVCLFFFYIVNHSFAPFVDITHWERKKNRKWQRVYVVEKCICLKKHKWKYIQRINTITPHVSIQLPSPSFIHCIGRPVVGQTIHRCVCVCICYSVLLYSTMHPLITHEFVTNEYIELDLACVFQWNHSIPSYQPTKQPPKHSQFNRCTCFCWASQWRCRII